MKKFCKHLNQIRRYGLVTELVTIYQHIIRHNYWDYELRIKRQKYYESIPKSEYEIELKKWYYQKTGHTLDLEKPRRFKMATKVNVLLGKVERFARIWMEAIVFCFT